MVIVKFLSESDCDLYIDTEFFCAVSANLIRKIELEVGSYLIEALDAEGKKISSQVLNIEQSQRQIFLQLSSGATSLNATLQELKNKSDVEFYNHRLKFKHNGKYGYIDSRFDVVIQPEYSDAEDFIKDKALVKKRFSDCEKVTIIDITGAICYSGWFDFVGEDETTMLLLHNGILTTIAKSDYSILAKYKSTHYGIVDELIPVSKNCGIDEMFGYINKAGKEIIPFIYDYVSRFSDSGYAKVIRFGLERAVDRNGSLYINYEAALKNGTEATRTVYPSGPFSKCCESSYEEKPHEEKYIYHAPKISKEEACVMDFEITNDTWAYTPVKIDNMWGLKEYNPWEDILLPESAENEEAIEPSILYKCDRIFYCINGYIAYRIGTECKLLSINDPDKIYTYKYDAIFPVILLHNAVSEEEYVTMEEELLNIIVKKNGKYGLIDVEGKIILPLEYDNIEITKADVHGVLGRVGIIWKNSKCMLINLVNGEILNESQFDEIIVNSHPLNELYSIESTLLVRKDGKLGCFGLLMPRGCCSDLRMSEIASIIYDDIEVKYEVFADGYHYTITLRIGEKVGIHESMQCVLSGLPVGSYGLFTEIAPEYNECIFLKNSNHVKDYKDLVFFAVRKDDKWGILDVHPFSTHFIDMDFYKYEPNKKIEFKYDSLDSLMGEANEEFKKRHMMYRKSCYHRNL